MSLSDEIWRAIEPEFIRCEQLTQGDMQTLLKHRHGIDVQSEVLAGLVRKWVKTRIARAGSKDTPADLTVYQLRGAE